MITPVSTEDKIPFFCHYFIIVN